MDINPHCLWKKQLVSVPQSKFDYAPLDRWRPFQSQIPLKDQVLRDSSLEVIPGIHLFVERYYQIGTPGEGLTIPPRHYNCHLKKGINDDLIDLFVYVRRIPEDWDPTILTALPTQQEISKMDRNQIVKYLTLLKSEIRKLEKTAEFPKAGDFIIWDMRLAHQNGTENLSKQVRQTFYHAYLPCAPLNEDTISKIKDNRDKGIHPDDFPKSHAHIEQKFERCTLSDLGNLLYHHSAWTNDTQITDNTPTYQLTPNQITFFRRYGFLVIPNCIPQPLIESLKNEIDEKFKVIAGIDTNNILASGKEQWKKIGGSFGGMIELFWCRFQDEIRQHPNPYWVIVQLYESTWFNQNHKELGYDHPFMDINPRHLWLYCDRMNYRLPEDILRKICNKKF
jgi:hypothetical protein